MLRVWVDAARELRGEYGIAADEEERRVFKDDVTKGELGDTKDLESWGAAGVFSKLSRIKLL